MAAIDDLKTGIKDLSDQMSESKNKETADENYAEQLAILIDNHVKAHVAELTATAVASLGLVAGQYPVSISSPATANLTIKDS